MGRGVLAVIVVSVWVLSATGFAQEPPERTRVTRRAPSRGAGRPVARVAPVPTSTQSRTPTGARDRGSAMRSRQDRTTLPDAAPGDDLFRAGPVTFSPRFHRPGRSFRHRQWLG